MSSVYASAALEMKSLAINQTTFLSCTRKVLQFGIRSAWVVPVSERLGLPLVAVQLDGTLTWRNYKFQSLPATQSVPATQLTTAANAYLPAAANYSWNQIHPGETYNTPPGSFTMMRKDGKPLKEAHAQAVVDYCASVHEGIQLDSGLVEDYSIMKNQ
ncbi:hypothetical protein G6011_02398 [Alternaria panax]|uniref:Uncharacterized protein n=1 Tax=Alternaria panax TaxID=48097 RepID=A0AAD4I4I5_9PLEO|nr:hypothetical protein G6011_02398 [Alternaria panax]